jgi:hypothetical protein
MRKCQTLHYSPLCSWNTIFTLFHLLDFVKRLEISEAEIIHKHPSPEAEFLDVIGTKVLTLKKFPPCFSQSPLLTDFTPASHPPQKWFATICNVNIVCGNFNSEDYQDNAQ